MIIDCLLPQNIKVCQPGVLLVREIVSQAVLLEVIDLISDPDFINEAIVLLATFCESEIDQSEVSSKENENGTDEQSSCTEKNTEENHYVQTLSAEVRETPNSSDNCCHKANYHNDKVCAYQARRDNQPILTETNPSSQDFRESCNDESGKNIETFSHTEKVIRYDDHAVAKIDSKVEVIVQNPHQSADPKGDKVSPEKPETGEDTTQERLATKEQISSSNENLLQPNFEKAATFSGLSNFMPVPLPRRNKSPAFSTLSKSVDSIVELEATSDETVAERKERRGHSRNSSFPSFTLDSDTEDDQIQAFQDEGESEDGEPSSSGGRDESGREAEKYISNLVISSTEQMQEKHSKKTFVLYVVKFNILASRNEDEVGLSVIPLQAKRRYREFVTLHWKLEQHADFKKFLKGVKDAPKRFAFPIMRKDTAGVEQRRVTLERYLKQLVDIPEIQISQEMAEFLALNGDANIAFVRNSSSFRAPNFDMLLRNSFSGMKQGLKNLAPFPSSKLDQKEDRSKVTVQSTSAGMEEDEEAISPQVYRVCSMASEGSELNLLDRMPSMIQEALTGLELAVEAMQDTSDLVQSDVIRRILKDKVPTGKNNPHGRMGERRVAMMDTSSLELFSKIMNIVGVLQRDQAHWIFEENVQHLLRNLTGDFIEKFVRREVQTFLSPQSWSVYLALIREAVWPEGNLFSSVEGILTSEEKQELYKKAEGIVLNAYPDVLNFIIGKKNMTGAISQLLESVQNQQLNKHLIYTFIDLVLEQALPEVQQEKAKETLAL
ncbi:putative sorting nexin-19 isoform X3 [Apostichopus japonicus]|uniref:Putative sorting nexin-19 isoform X3 n=1 Tax=Stichopus japonicus TaxID=307972 RepID=A0A2G8KH10_STIJA|nr:putative sorting nexin-19 isoform X3 [Apostichopus japonicus]